jgi:hypothetical protein
LYDFDFPMETCFNFRFHLHRAKSIYFENDVFPFYDNLQPSPFHFRTIAANRSWWRDTWRIADETVFVHQISLSRKGWQSPTHNVNVAVNTRNFSRKLPRWLLSEWGKERRVGFIWVACPLQDEVVIVHVDILETSRSCMNSINTSVNTSRHRQVTEVSFSPDEGRYFTTEITSNPSSHSPQWHFTSLSKLFLTCTNFADGSIRKNSESLDEALGNFRNLAKINKTKARGNYNLCGLIIFQSMVKRGRTAMDKCQGTRFII